MKVSVGLVLLGGLVMESTAPLTTVIDHLWSLFHHAAVADDFGRDATQESGSLLNGTHEGTVRPDVRISKQQRVKFRLGILK